MPTYETDLAIDASDMPAYANGQRTSQRTARSKLVPRISEGSGGADARHRGRLVLLGLAARAGFGPLAELLELRQQRFQFR